MSGHSIGLLLFGLYPLFMIAFGIVSANARHDANDAELMVPLEFFARVLIHIREPNKYLVRFYIAYANRVQ